MTVADLIAALGAHPADMEIRIDVATGHVEASEPASPSLSIAVVADLPSGGERWVHWFAPAEAQRRVLLIA